MTGIYKITSPSGKVYIGQSVNIKKRIYAYKSLACKEQPILYRSFVKYGVENHVFEVVEHCEFDQLNTRERYWQELYEVIGKNGLNCQYTNTKEKKIIVSESTKEKHRKRCGENHPSWGKKRTQEQRERMSKAKRNIKKGPMSEETKKKLSIAKKGKKSTYVLTDYHRQRIIEANKGRKHAEESLAKMRKPKSEETKKRMRENHRLSIIILDTNTGFYYNSISELCSTKGYNGPTIWKKLKGIRRNNTPYVIA